MKRDRDMNYSNRYIIGRRRVQLGDEISLLWGRKEIEWDIGKPRQVLYVMEANDISSKQHLLVNEFGKNKLENSKNQARDCYQ